VAMGITRDGREELPGFLVFDDPVGRKTARTSDAIERRFRGVRRRTRPTGVVSGRTSMERKLLAVFTYRDQKDEDSAPLLLPTRMRSVALNTMDWGLAGRRGKAYRGCGPRTVRRTSSPARGRHRRRSPCPSRS
jgi:hypothetical protein